MSDAFVTILPVDSLFVPGLANQHAVFAVVAAVFAGAEETTLETSDDVRFIDAGSNWEGVSCPACGSDLEVWWAEAMTLAAASAFRDLVRTPPCCKLPVSLNELDYRWPVGFARWSLRVRNPKSPDVSESDLRRLGDALGCAVRVVRGHL